MRCLKETLPRRPMRDRLGLAERCIRLILLFFRLFKTDPWGLEKHPAWQAFGLACLVLLYFFAAYRLSRYPDDPVLSGHSRSALGCGIALLVISALWSLTDLSSAP